MSEGGAYADGDHEAGLWLATDSSRPVRVPQCRQQRCQNLFVRCRLQQAVAGALVLKDCTDLQADIQPCVKTSAVAKFLDRYSPYAMTQIHGGQNHQGRGYEGRNNEAP